MRNEYIIVRGTCQSPTRFISPALNPRSHLSEAGDGERESFRPLPDAAPPPAGGGEREAEREFASPFPPAGLGEREREAERAGGGAARPLLARPPLSRSRDDFVSISRRPSRDERRSSRLEAQRRDLNRRHSNSNEEGIPARLAIARTTAAMRAAFLAAPTRTRTRT